MATQQNLEAIYTFDGQHVDDWSSASSGCGLSSGTLLPGHSRSLTLTDGDWWESQKKATGGGEGVFTKFHFRLSSLGFGSYHYFFQAMDAGGRCWGMQTKSGGAVRVLDASGNTVNIFSNNIVTNTWYTVIVLWSHKDSGVWKAWLYKTETQIPDPLSPNADTNGNDLRTGSAGAVYHRHEHNGAGTGLVADGAMYHDESVTLWHADITPPPMEFRILGPLASEEASVTADFGVDLDAGTWANMIQIPYNDAVGGSKLRTTAVGGVSAQGGTYGGPVGNPLFNGLSIMGVGHRFRAKKSGGVVNGRIGGGAQVDPAVDGATTTAITLTTSYEDFYRHYKSWGDLPDPECPGLDQHSQMKFYATGLGSNSMLVSTHQAIFDLILSIETTALRDLIGGIIPFKR